MDSNSSTMIDVARITGLACLIASTLADPQMFRFVIRADVQIILGAIIVFLVLFADHIFGFLIGLSAIVLYSRVFMHVYGIDIMGRKSSGRSSAYSTGYVTPKNLEDAQTNVFDPTVMGMPYKGIHGVYGEAVYSAQGYEAGSSSGGWRGSRSCSGPSRS